jgi:hypothetical protein
MPEPQLSIVPETKLDEILTAFPKLENLLLELLPSFAKLQTPILRKTVARTLTLEQAAASSNASLPDVVRKLRQAAGLTEEVPETSIAGAPAWIKSENITKTIDSRPMLTQGVHPKDMVVETLKALGAKDILLLIAPFVPGPLIEIGRIMGFQTWTRQKSTGYVETYFGKA